MYGFLSIHEDVYIILHKSYYVLTGICLTEFISKTSLQVSK
jgi:hypothetical protein